MASIAFNDFFQQPSSTPVCVRAGRVIAHAELLAHVLALIGHLQQQPQNRWILAAGDTYHFMCGFLALFAAGKEVVLPANIQAGTLTESIADADAILTDLTLSSTIPSLNIQACYSSGATDISHIEVEQANCFLELCTSGSTGEPKQIRKSLNTLFAEIAYLEELWGATLVDCTVVSTVSHQHIYGLLFRLLWPLYCHRLFICENVEYPEQLEAYQRQYGQLALISSPAYLKRMIEVLQLEPTSPGIKVIFSSGGPLQRDIALAYAQRLGVTPIEVLGSTETGGIAYRQQRADIEVAWHKLPPVQIRREPVSGALEVQSPFCFSPQWYAMGDAVEIIDDKHFRLLGRIDRIIKLEEKRISLDAMEKQLGKHPWIEAVRIVVLQGPRTVLGAACVLTTEGQSCLDQAPTRVLSSELKNYLADYFDRVTLPRKWRYIPEFPYNTQGKVTQVALHQLFEEKLDD